MPEGKNRSGKYKRRSKSKRVPIQRIPAAKYGGNDDRNIGDGASFIQTFIETLFLQSEQQNDNNKNNDETVNTTSDEKEKSGNNSQRPKM